ncbi:hypothetical protein CYY_008356, partial [Polysphondylium violaceum]
MFSSKEKLEYNISIRFQGGARDYLDIKQCNREVINVIDIQSDTLYFDLNEIHDGVHTLMVDTENDYTSVTGELPLSINYLHLSNSFDYRPPIVEQIVSNLPGNVQELVLDMNRDTITGPCIIPESVTILGSNDSFYYQNLKWFEVSPNKVYMGCQLLIDSVESFEWLLANKWICSVEFARNVLNMLVGRQQLPSHVIKVGLDFDIVQDTSFLPHKLESLACRYGTPFSHFAHLKVLKIINDYPIKLEKGVLPPTLQKLRLYYEHALEADILPPHLTTLYLYDYNHPLCANLLPSSITRLSLLAFNQPLFTNVLPSSLTRLNLTAFNQPLNAFVLPSKLKTLYMLKFNQPTLLQNSLPVSL